MAVRTQLLFWFFSFKKIIPLYRDCENENSLLQVDILKADELEELTMNGFFFRNVNNLLS